jgi:hypothetical protein
MSGDIQSGKRRVRVWASSEWVTILHGEKAGTFRVVPEDSSGEFTVAAGTDAELNDRIPAELRRRHPQDR